MQFNEQLRARGGHLVVWCDFMKLGCIGQGDLNHCTELLKKALAHSPEKACAVVIAPQIASERRSGLREEYRWGCVQNG